MSPKQTIRLLAPATVTSLNSQQAKTDRTQYASFLTNTSRRSYGSPERSPDHVNQSPSQMGCALFHHFSLTGDAVQIAITRMRISNSVNRRTPRIALSRLSALPAQR